VTSASPSSIRGRDTLDDLCSVKRLKADKKKHELQELVNTATICAMRIFIEQNPKTPTMDYKAIAIAAMSFVIAPFGLDEECGAMEVAYWLDYQGVMVSRKNIDRFLMYQEKLLKLEDFDPCRPELVLLKEIYA
jgi:hypothetical protein